jgi:hypothetical protein
LQDDFLVLVLVVVLVLDMLCGGFVVLFPRSNPRLSVNAGENSTFEDEDDDEYEDD